LENVQLTIILNTITIWTQPLVNSPVTMPKIIVSFVEIITLCDKLKSILLKLPLNPSQPMLGIYPACFTNTRLSANHWLHID